ncbi:MarR family winged helix-turn-helix transcriptional regulator [Mycobacterium intracellulare]|uniref:MarR family winged helix-turn-helix transcriptional regulator n=1 Tax=Mycobacterium intracellulare TaxID=1767 RepID=UPI0009EC8DE6|nr:MarR family winged helix-turn-helix transcriptional regulator [Mycobacterium intracellulare]MCA2312497.1 winged helix-turn-helix transcriptional regulator [Mycobacterium intracellulare subsp. chimaera]MCA2354734.1 winged helix-turn-helix transcriptional regulator [Mycobacterium intracellulare subsp. chimaera]
MKGAELVSKSTPRRVRALSTQSAVPPIGGSVDVGLLPLTALVARLTYQISRSLADAYKSQGVTAQPLDASLFVLLAQGGARLTAVAERLDTSKQALSFVVSRLERDGYLVRVDDPEDKRARQIQLTDAGHRVAAITADALRRIEVRWRSRLGEDWPQLRAALADVVAESERSTHQTMP